MTTKLRKSSLLQAARAFRARRSHTDTAIHHFLSSLDTPRALTVWLLYKHGEHDQLTALEVNPDDYLSHLWGVFRLDYEATNFLSKASFLKTTFDRKVVAYDKFLKFETLCMQTNRRFLLRNLRLDSLANEHSAWLLNATKRKISMVLGDFSGDEFVDEANWGPGVSTLIKGEEVSGYNKFHAERGITRDLYTLISPWFSVAYPSWSEHLNREFGAEWPVFEVGNRVVTVPKNSKTDRVIAIEPGINLWFQKAIGSMIRRRLRRFGIDLNSQVRNQQLALQGSRDSSLATVDFSSASDSISKEVVEELLPRRWYLLLDACRSKVGRLADDSIIRWEKFSSMGNGFTFELESLIFWAAAEAVREYLGVEGPVSVFGDDVVLPSACFDTFSEFSAFLGFRVNESKSFYSLNSHFRESCGSHYYKGMDCKPVFLKERLSNVETFYKLANGIRNLAHRHNSHRGCDTRFHDCWLDLVERVPEALRFRVPVSAGDTGFVSNFDEAVPRRARYGIEGFYYRSLVSVGLSRRGDGQALILARLRSPSLLEYGNNYTLRGRTRRVIADPLVPQWYNLGGWY